MYSFDAERLLHLDKQAIEARSPIEKAAADIWQRQFDKICFLGIGGSYSSGLVMQSFTQSNSSLPYLLCNAGELIYADNKAITDKTVVFTYSKSGDTPELLEGVKRCQAKGARVYGVIEKEGSPLAKQVDVQIAPVNGGYYKLYYFFGSLMKHWGDFPQYDALCENMERLPEALIEAARQMDDKARAYAEAYGDAPMQYLVGAGNTWGVAYCFAMCYMEEMQWMRTKSIHAAEFFHGTLEVIEKGVPVMLFKGEDGGRQAVERVERFCRRVTEDVTVFDSKEYALEGIDPAFRGMLSSFVFRALEERLFMNLEDVNKHPGEIRRYYRQIAY